MWRAKMKHVKIKGQYIKYVGGGGRGVGQDCFCGGHEIF